MLSDEELEQYREVFSFFDRDGGGSITAVELGQVSTNFLLRYSYIVKRIE